MLDLDAGFDVELADAVAAVVDAWKDGWTIPAKLTVSQFADAHRMIAKGAGAEPGQWRTSRNPQLREIQDSLSDHCHVQRVDFKKSAQIGATEVGINWVCYIIHLGLDSMIVAQPVKDLARSWSTTKFEPAVAMMSDLSERLDSGSTLEKRYPGGTLWAIWANSSNQLRQRTARFLFEDEVDEYPDDLGGQGGADEQLEARAMSFGDRAKIYRACTPTVAGRSKIDKGFQAGDQRHYLVPCPGCGAHQSLDVERLQPNGTFACAANGCVIEEHHKSAMLVERSACAGCGEVPVRVIDRIGDQGALVYADDCACGRVLDPPEPDGAYWQPRNPHAPASHRSYHIWAAYTPEGLGLTWREIANRRAAAAADASRQAAFDNLICGEVHEGERQEQNADELERLAEPGVNRGVVPRGALVLTAGIDCQQDRFEIQVIGKGRGQRTRVVDYAVVDGDPSRPDGFEELDTYLQGTWLNSAGRPLHITSLAIDGGNWTDMVARYLKGKVSFSGNTRLVKVANTYRKQWMYLVRGRSEKKSERAVYRPSKTEVNAREKTVARSVGMWGVGTSVLKHIIHGWLNSALAAKAAAETGGDPEDIETRMIRFPGGRGEVYDPLHPDPGALPPTYYRGLACEYFDLDAQEWVTPRGARNEPLDTLVYAEWAALAPAVKVDAMRESQWAALEAELEPDPNDLFAPPIDGGAPRGTTEAATAPPAVAPRGTSTAPASHGWGSSGGTERGWGR